MQADQSRRGFTITSLDELDRIPLEDSHWRPVRRTLGVTAFGINGYTANAGEEVIEPHDETSAGAGGHEELYAVVAGAAEFTADGERLEAPTGTLVRVDVGVHRSAIATQDETTVLVIGGAPGAALPVSPFEYWYAAQGPYSRGDYAGAIEVASDGLADYPEHPSLHYQLACYHSLAGDSDRAVEHLATAAAGNPEVLDWAADDADLNAIRAHPRFPAS